MSNSRAIRGLTPEIRERAIDMNLGGATPNEVIRYLNEQGVTSGTAASRPISRKTLPRIVGYVQKPRTPGTVDDSGVPITNDPVRDLAGGDEDDFMAAEYTKADLYAAQDALEVAQATTDALLRKGTSVDPSDVQAYILTERDAAWRLLYITKTMHYEQLTNLAEDRLSADRAASMARNTAVRVF